MKHVSVTDDKLVICQTCGEALGKVNDVHTAILRAGQYAEHECQIVLYGAGTIGRVMARKLIANGTPPIAFADNKNFADMIEGIPVHHPKDALDLYPDAKWIATVHRTPFRAEILASIEELGVKSLSLWKFMPGHTEIPPESADETIGSLLLNDKESWCEWVDQIGFRHSPATYAQIPHSDISNVYFEGFFTRLDDESFIDCGAADGDTIREFQSRWKNYSQIRAFEPDPENYRKLCVNVLGDERVHTVEGGVWDSSGVLSFDATGDQSAHFGGDTMVHVYRLDHVVVAPTFIKMDIEGAELEALWGARETIRKHSPVLAICAYHTGDHLWQIPLLIHAINPSYRLYLRRYLEGTLEMVWYAVPPERVKS